MSYSNEMVEGWRGMEKVPSYNTWVNRSPMNTTYTFTGPTSGSNGQASTAFTVSLPTGTMSNDVVVTMGQSGTGTAGVFSKATIFLSNAQRSDTFTYTPGSTGDKIISVTNNAGTSTDGTSLIANPASITYASS